MMLTGASRYQQLRLAKQETHDMGAT